MATSAQDCCALNGSGLAGACENLVEGTGPRPSSPSGPGRKTKLAAEVTLSDMSEIRQMAERLNPGVGARVSMADYESIVVSCAYRFGLPFPRRLAFTPAPSVAVELSQTIGTLTRAVADLSVSPAKVVSTAQPQPLARRPPTPKSTPAPPKGEQKKTKAPSTGKPTPPPASPTKKAEVLPKKTVEERRREKLKKKCLLALKTSAGWKFLAEEQGVTTSTVLERIAALTDLEIEKLDPNLPPLVRSGIITQEKLVRDNWADEIALDDAFTKQIALVRSIAEAAEHKEDRALDLGLPLAPDSRHPSTVNYQLTDPEQRFAGPVTDRAWDIPGITAPAFSEASVASLATQTGLSEEEVRARLRVHWKPYRATKGFTPHLFKCELSVLGTKRKCSYFVQVLRPEEGGTGATSIFFTSLTAKTPTGADGTSRISVGTKDTKWTATGDVRTLLAQTESGPGRARTPSPQATAETSKSPKKLSKGASKVPIPSRPTGGSSGKARPASRGSVRGRGRGRGQISARST